MFHLSEHVYYFYELGFMRVVVDYFIVTSKAHSSKMTINTSQKIPIAFCHFLIMREEFASLLIALARLKQYF